MLSSNNRGFVNAGSRFEDSREHLNDEDDEDVRLETYRRGQKIDAYKAVAVHDMRGKRVVEILEESPNGYVITGRAPPEIDRAIKYYSFQLRHFTVQTFAEEYGLIHYSLGKVFYNDDTFNVRNYDHRAKSIENALHHLRTAAEVFDNLSHPFLFGAIMIFAGQLFRERATLISNRSILAKRGVTVADSCELGLTQLMEAQIAFSGSKLHDTEYAMANMELAWVYILQLTEALEEQDRSPEESELVLMREQAILALDRSHELVRRVVGGTAPDGEKPRTWDPQDRTTHPEHIRMMLRGQSVAFVDGMISYLYGRIYQDWSDSIEHQAEAIDHYNRAVKPNRLPMDTDQWVDCHHRAAAILIKHPQVIEETWGENPTEDSDICYVSAANHLTIALKSPTLRHARRMDICFHLAQANIARLNMITDRVPEGKSLVKSLKSNDGLSIMKVVEENLVLAMHGATAANTQSTQDAFVYFFSSLKLSEFRMLEAAASSKLSDADREELLEDSIGQLINAILSRSIIDNMDLHYISTAQMSQLLLAAKRDRASAKWFGKCLMVLGAMANRLHFEPSDTRAVTQEKIWGELGRASSQALQGSSRCTTWMKHHLGPVVLTEAPVSGFAYWNFEDNRDPDEIPPVVVHIEKELTMVEAKAARAPPKSIMPHLSESERQHMQEKTMLQVSNVLYKYMYKYKF